MTFAAAPACPVDGRSKQVAYGTYEGSFLELDVAPLASRLNRLRTEKRWVYLSLAAPPWLISLAVIDLGLATTGFAFVQHAERGLVLDMPTRIGLPWVSGVRTDGVRRVDAVLRSPSLSLRFVERRGADAFDVELDSQPLTLRASLSRTRPGLAVAAKVAGGVVNLTEKHALLGMHGAAVFRGERIELEGGFGAFDLTWGLLPRHTVWKWAFAQGHDDGGVPIALNLVEGFVGEPECVVFFRDRLVAVSEGRIEVPRSPERPWTVRTARGEVDLRFVPSGVHREAVAVGPFASRFVQPMGHFEGTITVEGRRHTVSNLRGVVEDQDVRW